MYGTPAVGWITVAPAANGGNPPGGGFCPAGIPSTGPRGVWLLPYPVGGSGSGTGGDTDIEPRSAASLPSPGCSVRSTQPAPTSAIPTAATAIVNATRRTSPLPGPRAAPPLAAGPCLPDPRRALSPSGCEPMVSRSEEHTSELQS